VATFTLDIPNKRIVLASPQTTYTLQELHDQCRDFEDRPEMMAQGHIVNTTGKDDLFNDGTFFSALIVRMMNDWRLYADARGGPSQTTITGTGGTLIATNTFGNDPIEDSAFVSHRVPIAHAGTILNIDQVIDIWTRLFGGRLLTDASTGKETIRDAAAALFSEADIYSDDGVTPYDGTAGIARRDPHIKP